LGIERDLHIGERTLGDILGHTKEPEEAGMGRLREEP
jgi:hypothetical protein